MGDMTACQTQVTGAVGWRKDNLRYKKNEVFLDIVEQVCTYSCQIYDP